MPTEALPEQDERANASRRVLRLALDYAEAEGWIVTTPCVEVDEKPEE